MRGARCHEGRTISSLRGDRKILDLFRARLFPPLISSSPRSSLRQRSSYRSAIDMTRHSHRSAVFLPLLSGLPTASSFRSSIVPSSLRSSHCIFNLPQPSGSTHWLRFDWPDRASHLPIAKPSGLPTAHAEEKLCHERARILEALQGANGHWPFSKLSNDRKRSGGSTCVAGRRRRCVGRK